MSGIHTHSGPGGYLQYILYIITSLGFVRESFDVLVGGIVEVRPHHVNMDQCMPCWRMDTPESHLLDTCLPFYTFQLAGT